MCSLLLFIGGETKKNFIVNGMLTKNPSEIGRSNHPFDLAEILLHVGMIIAALSYNLALLWWCQ